MKEIYVEIIRQNLGQAGFLVVLLVLAIISGNVEAKEYGCLGCQDKGLGQGQISAIDWLTADEQSANKQSANTDNSTSDPIASSTSLSLPQKSRLGMWHKPLSGIENETGQAQKQSSQRTMTTSMASTKENATIIRTTEAKKMMLPISEVSNSGVLLDISQNSSEHIAGSIVIPYEEFMIDSGHLKPLPDISKILGDSGISQDDLITIYGECMRCGGGPAPATYVYWIMRSLGNDKIRVLDGTVEDWKALGKQVTSETRVKPSKNYVLQFNPDFSASYNEVKTGQVQVVDARSSLEYAMGSIPGSINIPYNSLIQNSRIKDESELKKIFMGLNPDRPVVIYTDTGIKASVVWFTLELMGYKAKLYSWQDWLANQAYVVNSTIKGVPTIK
jgi:thiosulfate/3-mercaptopyruvate sulfurtransferase